MRRREFIAALGGAAAWPLLVYGQPNDKKRVGFLSSRSPAESATVVAAFRQALSEVGFTKAKMRKSSFVGPKVNTTGCQLSQKKSLISESP